MELLKYILEMPITTRDARRRHLPASISKLVIYSERERGEAEQEITAFSKLLMSIKPNNLVLYAQPITSYVHLRKYEAALRDRNFNYHFDAQYTAGQRKKPALLWVQCDDPTKIEAVFHIFGVFQAEAIVFFLKDGQSDNAPLEASLMKQRYGTGYEAAYLQQIGDCPLVAFFENSRVSLELLGTTDFILRAFSIARVTEGPIPHVSGNS